MRNGREVRVVARRAGLAARRMSITGVALRATPATPVQWRELRVPRRAVHSMVWDSRRGRALMLGGDDGFEGAPPFQGVWQLVRGSAPRWEPLGVTGDGPLPRAGMCAVYDSLRDRVLAFGGRAVFDGPGSSELWQLSLTGTPAWSLVDASAGVTPPARWAASMVVDGQDR